MRVSLVARSTRGDCETCTVWRQFGGNWIFDHPSTMKLKMAMNLGLKKALYGTDCRDNAASYSCESIVHGTAKRSGDNSLGGTKTAFLWIKPALLRFFGTPSFVMHTKSKISNSVSHIWRYTHRHSMMVSYLSSMDFIRRSSLL